MSASFEKSQASINVRSDSLAVITARFEMLPRLEEEVSVANAGKARVLLPGVVTAVQIVIVVAP